MDISEGKKMRMGRPTEEPKRHRLEIRLTEKQKEEIEYCCKKLQMNRTELIMLGLQKIRGEIDEG